MKIERIELDGFGHFSDYALGPFDAPLTVLLGPNEAGKSTLLAAIRAILFGFPQRGGNKHYPPLEGGRHGGRLHVVDSAGERMTIERYQGARGGPVSIFAASGAALPEAALQQLLGGHSKDVFEQIFAFTLDELTSDKLLEDNEVNGQIYSAGIGAARLPKAVREIADQRDGVFAPRGRVHRMAQTSRAFEEVQSQLREVERNADRYAELTELARQLESAVREAEEKRHSLQAQSARAQLLMQAWEPWVELAETERQIERLDVAEFPADGIPRLEQFEERMRNAASAADAARLRVESAREAAGVQIEHEDILSRSADVSALQSGMDRFLSAVDDLPRREQERVAHQAQLDDALLALGGDWDLARLDAFRFSDADQSELERHRLLLGDARDARRTAQARRDDAASELAGAEPRPDDDALLARGGEIAQLERGRAAFADALANLPEAQAELRASGREAERALADLGAGWNAQRLDQLDLSIDARDEINEFAQRLRTADDETARLSALAVQSRDLLEESRREEASAREALDAAAQPELDSEAISDRRSAIRAMQARLRDAEAARHRIGALELQVTPAGGPEEGADEGAEETKSRRDWNRIIGGLGILAGIVILAIGVALGGDSLVVGVIAGILLAAIGASLFPSRRRARGDADSPIARNTRDSLRREREQEESIAAELADGAAVLGIERVDEEALIAVGTALDQAADLLRGRDELAHRLAERETRRGQREQAADAATEAAETAAGARSEIERQWSAWLSQRGLRDSFRPDGVNELVGAATVARQALAALRRSRERVQRLEQGVAQFTAAVEPLAAEFGGNEPGDPAGTEAATAALVERHAAAELRAAQFRRAKAAEDSAGRELEAAIAASEEAAAAWRGWLHERGLDPGFAPDAVLRLREQVETARARRLLLADTERRIDGMRKNIDEYAADAASLAAAFGDAVDAASPASVELAARRLIDLLADVARRADQRRVAGERLAEAEQALAGARNDRDGAHRELDALLDRGGASPGEDPELRAEDFRRRADLFDERQRALERRASLQRQLRQLGGVDARFDAFIAELRASDREQIEARGERLGQEAAEAARELREASERLGTVGQQLDDLGGESESSRLRLERERLIERARGDAREWAKHQLAGWLLARTREKFEAERQPDVLRHAQEFMAAASGGRYRQVQAPLGEQRINLVEAGGAAKEPAQLSRGTREQLYLALRFGLIRELGARTEPLPVVVDEVLVNFDPGRAEQAALAFHGLAETHQVLVFTCHPETAERFEAAAAMIGAQRPGLIGL